MIERVTEDRRNKKVDVEADLREIRRREEDRANIKSYYGVLGLCIGFLLCIGTISFIWGR